MAVARWWCGPGRPLERAGNRPTGDQGARVRLDVALLLVVQEFLDLAVLLGRSAPVPAAAAPGIWLGGYGRFPSDSRALSTGGADTGSEAAVGEPDRHGEKQEQATADWWSACECQ
ncbi:hypothetical protein GCM10009664_04840 [Kitasatospora gansuensis]